MTCFVADAVLFDNDGVLVDSHPQVVAAWTQVATENGLDIDRLLVELVGRRSRDTLGQYLSGDDLDRAEQRLEALEVSSATATEPIVGAVEFVAQLPPGRWTIVTSGALRLAAARWQGAGIPIPDKVVTAEDVRHGKPDPEPFVLGAHRLGTEPDRVIVFEDSPSGGQAGLAAGATVIAVGDLPWPSAPHARVRDLSEVSVTVLPDDRLEVCVSPGAR